MIFSLRKRTKIVIGISILLLLATMLLLVQYFNVRGFKKSLEALVETGTGGAYTLHIESTEIDHFNTSFSLQGIRIVRLDNDTTTDILEVRIPELTIDVGALVAMISSRQFKINEFRIVEPIARIKLPTGSIPPEEKPKQQINYAHQIAKFWPAVKAILEHFDIAQFRIERAGLDLLDNDTSDINIRLLDLLVTQWNLRNLSDSAQFKLSLGDQVLSMPGSEFKFAAVEYQFTTNELDILDYRFIQMDSVLRPQVVLEGESIKIINLDYQKLVGDEAYVVDQLLISRPRLMANLYPKKGRTTESWHPLSDLLKKNLGNLKIREGRILNAQMELTLFSKSDTLALHLPSLSLNAAGFEVNEDSTTLMIKDLNLDIHSTKLDLNETLSVGFSNLSYDELDNVQIDSLQVKDRVMGNTLLSCHQVDLYNFSIFNYFYENDFRMDSLVLNKGQINLLRDPAEISHSGIGGAGSEDQENLPPKLHIGRFRFENIQVNASFDHLKARMSDISGAIDHFAKEDQVSYSLNFFQGRQISYLDTHHDLDLHVTNAILNPVHLRTASIEAGIKSLNFKVQQLTAIPTVEITGLPFSNLWKDVEIGSFMLEGSIPENRKNSNHINSLGTELLVKRLKVGKLSTNLSLSDTSAVTALLDQVQVVNGGVRNGEAHYDQLKAILAELVVQSGENTLKLGRSSINSDSLSNLNNLDITNGTKYRLAVEDIDVAPWIDSSGILEIDYVKLGGLRYADLSHQNLSKADSIKMINLRWSADTTPYARQVLVYAPDIKLAADENIQERVEPKKPPLSPLKLFGELHVSPGQITIDEQRIAFEKIDLEQLDNTAVVDLKAISFKTPNNSIHVGRIWSQGSSIFLDSIYMVPVTDYLESINVETDVLAAQLNRVHVRNVRWDSLFENSKLHCDEMLLDEFELSIKRDKTLPDPEYVAKPYLLEELIPVPDRIHLPKISGRKGRAVYIEKGEKTGQEGFLAIDDIEFVMNRKNQLDEPENVSNGSGLIYSQAPISYEYDRLDSGKFSLNVRLTDVPLPLLNQMVDPLQAARFKSGHLHEFEYKMTGDSVQASGQGIITYDDLHVEIFKSNQPDARNIGSELLTLLVDKVILKHSKSNAVAEFQQDRIPHKGPINYWVKSGIHAATASVIKGKPIKKLKKSKNGSAN